MKNEAEMNPAGKSGPNRGTTFIHLHEGDASLVDSSSMTEISGFEEMEKFEPVIKHFCFEQHIPLKELVESFERAVLIKVLSRFNGNQRQSAKYLGMKSSTLNEKIKKHNIHFKKEAY